MPFYRKEIHPSLLPVLAQAQWNLAAHIMRRGYGGDIIAKTALYKFREMAKSTEDLVELQKVTGGEVFLVSFMYGEMWEKELIDWAVEFTDEDDPDNGGFKELRDDWPATNWELWGN